MILHVWPDSYNRAWYGNPELLGQTWEATRGEVSQNGWLSGRFTQGQLSEMFGAGWVPNRRVGPKPQVVNQALRLVVQVVVLWLPCGHTFVLVVIVIAQRW